MSDLPLPLPDRRTLAKTSEQENNNIIIDKNKLFKPIEQIDAQKSNTINSEIQEGASLSFFSKTKTNRRYASKNT